MMENIIFVWKKYIQATLLKLIIQKLTLVYVFILSAPLVAKYINSTDSDIQSLGHNNKLNTSR